MIWKEMIEHVFLFITIMLIQIIEAKQGLANIHNLIDQRKWMTLNGGQPEIVARGGYSGFFPDSSQIAYDFANDISIPGTIMYCNVHFSQDGDGFCISQINLQNSTNIQSLYHKGEKTYNINGRQIRGWFGLDYPAGILFENVTLIQDNFMRQDTFDGEPLVSPFDFAPTQDAVGKKQKPKRVWLNIEYNIFYQQHKISPQKYLLEVLNPLPEFISSPEIGFLKTIAPKVAIAKTKIIFKFLAKDLIEPTTNKTYGSLVNELSMIRAFAFGIMVPKEYIWPMNEARVLQPATSLVLDAHTIGLSVYASGFANDNFLSYNYSYDPTREYLQFIDNSQFSVDGVFSDFPSTASEAIGCLAQNKNATRVVKSLIISHNGASGDFPGATDLAYDKAIEDGADIIDCSVQMSKDGVAFCSDRADLIKTTTAATLFMNRARNIPEIQETDGVFSFDLTWTEIQSLKPQIESSYSGDLVRNPENKNSGKFVLLSEFLELAKSKAVTGVLIFIQNAAYLASNASLDIVSTVSTALRNSTFEMQSTQKVLIQSDDSSVLLKFKDIKNYQKVLYLNETISGAPDQVALEIKKYADAVYVHRSAIVMESQDFVFNFTSTIPSLRAANISVYVGILKNEFMNFLFDYLSDPYIELETFNSLGVDGFVTDYPVTANAFARSTCTTKGSPYSIKPIVPGSLYEANPVAEPPKLSVAEVVDPPLPAVANSSTNDFVSNNTGSAPATISRSSSSSIGVSTASCIFAAMARFLVLLIV